MSRREKIKVFAPGLIPRADKYWAADQLPPPHYRSASDIIDFWERALLQLALYADEIYLRTIYDDRLFGGPAAHHVIPLDADPVPHIARTISLSAKLYGDYDYDANPVSHRLGKLASAGILRLYQHEYPVAFVGEWEPNEFDNYSDQFDRNADKSVLDGLGTADKLDCSYTTVNRREALVFKRWFESLGKQLSVEDSILSSLMLLKFPGLNLSPENLIKARMKEGSFDEFRRALRVTFRQLYVRLDNNDFERDARELQKDILIPELNRMITSAKRTRSLSDHLRSNSITFASSTLAAAAVLPEPTMAFAVGGASSSLRLMLQGVLERGKISPEARFVSHFDFDRELFRR